LSDERLARNDKNVTNLIKQNPEQNIAFRESVRKRTRNKSEKKVSLENVH
jgi:hypothetical protein